MASIKRVQVPFDLNDGEMKEFQPDQQVDQKILLSKLDGKVFATSAKCTHYGASLVNGVLSKDGSVTCPWHGACFDVKCGDVEDSPGVNHLQTFKVDSQDGQIFVSYDQNKFPNASAGRLPSIQGLSIQDKGFGVVIVGGGAGGFACAEGLREAGYSGKITVISKEPHYPIDRPKLSKALIDDASKIAIRDGAFYQNLDIKFVTGIAVANIEFQENMLILEDGSELEYDQLVLATGSVAKRLPVPGNDLQNILTLRTIEDVQWINEAVGDGEDKKKNVVVVGSSFIGMELCTPISKKANVTVVGMEKVPFESILGQDVGSRIQKGHEANGIKFELSQSLDRFEPCSKNPENVGAVVLKDGTRLEADVVILGVGVKPETSILTNTSAADTLTIHKDSSIEVDEYLRVKGIEKGNVFAIGDIARYPDQKTKKLVRIEHWNVAANHGRAVARTLSGKPCRYNKIAVFWSAQGAQLRYAGTGEASEFDNVLVQGPPNELKFIAYYTKQGKVVAVASMQSDPAVSHIANLLKLNLCPTLSEIQNGKDPLAIKLA